uniref:HAUS augmin-like complex subunit 8 n=1 Tax=Sciurus vulgaris TaxID=55149 RepID=A0A8D2JRY3_SCIVU
MKHQRISCLDLGPLPKISHRIYVNIPKSQTLNTSVAAISDQGYSAGVKTCSIRVVVASGAASRCLLVLTGVPVWTADGSGVGKGDLQSTLLEGHGTAPPDLDLSAINGKWLVSPPPSLLVLPQGRELGLHSFLGDQEELDLFLKELLEVMEMMESQTLLLSLLTLKMENSLAEFEEKAERNLLIVCREEEELQEQAHQLRRRLRLCQRTRELAEALNAQMELLSPFEAVCERFKEQYQMLATALDTTRHELPLRSIHLEGDGHQLLDALQRDLETTHRLLGELGIGGAEENEQVLALLSELRDVTKDKDLALRRIFSQVLELSAEASKEAALINQEVWEETQGLVTPSQWYFNADGLSPTQAQPSFQ